MFQIEKEGKGLYAVVKERQWRGPGCDT